jgi:hypothetical protein
MDWKHCVEESELESHLDHFQIPLQAGKDEFRRLLHEPLCSSKPILDKKQQDIQNLRKNTAVLRDCRLILTHLEDPETLLRSHVTTDSSKVAEGQIFFQGQHTRFLNFIPYAVSICVFLKVWIAPALALLTPLLLCIMPYVIMTSVMDMPITWDVYTMMMKQMILGVQGGEPWRLKHYVQAGWTLMSVGQGMVTPFLTAYHTQKLDAEIVKRGNALLKIVSDTREMVEKISPLVSNVWGGGFYLPDVPTEPHEAVAWMESEPLGIQQIWRVLGRISILVQIAWYDDIWHPVKFMDEDTPLTIKSFVDLAIEPSKCIYSSMDLKRHSILTGPNRGGKSSSLRAILQQVILGQTLGYTYGAVGTWKPFSLLFTRLKSRDTAGKESLFEMEVRHASQIIKTLQKTRRNALVLIDELFHSTNPPDAEISAKLFLKQLWSSPTTKSIISTHIFSLAEESKNIQLFCCQATEDSNGHIRYSYQMTEGGVCRVSSVHEVLAEAGLVGVCA